jgi:hypothetical protein
MLTFEDAVKTVETMRSEQQAIDFHARHTNVPTALTELLRKLQAAKDMDEYLEKVWSENAMAKRAELPRKLQAAKDADEAVEPKDTHE